MYGTVPHVQEDAVWGQNRTTSLQHGANGREERLTQHGICVGVDLLARWLFRLFARPRALLLLGRLLDHGVAKGWQRFPVRDDPLVGRTRVRRRDGGACLCCRMEWILVQVRCWIPAVALACAKQRDSG